MPTYHPLNHNNIDLLL